MKEKYSKLCTSKTENMEHMYNHKDTGFGRYSLRWIFVRVEEKRMHFLVLVWWVCLSCCCIRWELVICTSLLAFICFGSFVFPLSIDALTPRLSALLFPGGRCLIWCSWQFAPELKLMCRCLLIRTSLFLLSSSFLFRFFYSSFTSAIKKTCFFIGKKTKRNCFFSNLVPTPLTHP